jgi:hypothetical protein
MDGMSQDSDNLIVILCLTLLLEGEFSTFSKSLLNTLIKIAAYILDLAQDYFNIFSQYTYLYLLEKKQKTSF